MLEVYEIKKERYFIEFTSLMVYFLDLQSGLTEIEDFTIAEDSEANAAKFTVNVWGKS